MLSLLLCGLHCDTSRLTCPQRNRILLNDQLHTVHSTVDSRGAFALKYPAEAEFAENSMFPMREFQATSAPLRVAFLFSSAACGQLPGSTAG